MRQEGHTTCTSYAVSLLYLKSHVSKSYGYHYQIQNSKAV